MARSPASPPDETVVVTFRVTRGIADKLESAATELPALPGRAPVSIHQAARALLIQLLDEKEEEKR